MCKTRATRNGSGGVSENQRHDLSHVVAGTSHERRDFGSHGGRYFSPASQSYLLERTPEEIGHLLVLRNLEIALL